ncbi:MAG: hypothetical protein WCK39_10180 [Methanomassiliicoccales archaeon]
MPYRIPSVKMLSQTISEVLREKRTVSSQSRLAEAVNERLRKLDPAYTASEERIRKLAIFKSLARVHIHYRDTKKRSEKACCPVCGSDTVEIMNKTLNDERVELGFRCVKCPYWTGPSKRVPVRYDFVAPQEGVIEPTGKKKKRDGRHAQWKFA